ncbi:hypothetical protein, partial [Staphylococcus aureus]|uniref:hypothetical protein n=1 Tax=Staphylococcus aureus TaxID=1280 RepID=UPI003A7FF9A7
LSSIIVILKHVNLDQLVIVPCQLAHLSIKSFVSIGPLSVRIMIIIESISIIFHQDLIVVLALLIHLLGFHDLII